MSEIIEYEELPKREDFYALAYVATSAEYKALCLQTYRLARRVLSDKVDCRLHSNHAVLLDLDETVLDNSRFQAWLAASKEPFSPEAWDEWCDTVQATAISGAVEFLHFARQLGVAPIFITSRSNRTRKSTVQNLIAIGAIGEDCRASYESEDPTSTNLYMADMAGFSSHFMEDKFEQRQVIIRTRGIDVLLSIGDNLGDYAAYYKKGITKLPPTSTSQAEQRRFSAVERRASVDQDDPQWGADFLVLPNPTYGDWKRALERTQLGIKFVDNGDTIDPVETDLIPAWCGPKAKKS